MVTLKDIAKEANVSVTTVSNVIHGNYKRVAPETVEKIKMIIERDNYVPNMTARSLVNKLSKIIGVINHVVPEKTGNFISDPFHSVVIEGIEKKLREKGYYMMIRTVYSEEDLFSLLRNWNIDGLIIIGLFQDDFFEKLTKANIPFVLIDSYIDNKKVLNIGLDDCRGGYLATKYLIDKGHRNIVFASPIIKKNGVVEERLIGYKMALKEAGIPFEDKNVYQQEITITEGIELGHKLSRRTDITAVFATADILAAGIISGLMEEGKSVPDDISIVGFDDLYISSLTAPRLTTIHQDPQEKGKVAVETLVSVIEGSSIENNNIVLPVSIVERNSVKQIDK
ncbi:LacI family DNA-binding transcriptional regulator [Clostridium sp. YIM B02515]|uniref:LacI family DNA-binding transcriptional regulator n=1 Tax=Clostridium rhizosphaerae TaxID=2803861 RepID=A0ABS1TCE4_9CLOT|nr:LacI family DNA-binding transcriptional regulator [Clostridium rhizosphaerae]MBL4937038.1 LacI family DNA-binding transcriptional regulator [Clostridium rhizosphaerae]